MNRTQQLKEVTGHVVPLLPGLLSCKGRNEALAGDDVHLVDAVQDEVEDALLLKEILTISEGFQEFLLLLVPQVVLRLREVRDEVLEAAHNLAQVHRAEEAGVPPRRSQVVQTADELPWYWRSFNAH